jgi:protein-tyrosine phosphatase
MNDFNLQSIPINAVDRFVKFQRISNFRDLGGLPAAGGKIIRPGVLFRSGHLAHSTARDIRKLSSLGIQKIVDFRSEEETAREPDQLPSKPEINVHHFRIQENGLPPFGEEIRRRIENRTLNELDPSQLMIEMYRKLGKEYSSAYKNFFEVVKKSNGAPILWHCSAGKDRAGLASALIQKVLGVSDKIIESDYLLSTGRIAPRRRQLLLVTLLRGRKAGRFLRRINEVDSNWLSAAFQAVEDQWGDFESYTTQALNLNQRDIHQLREQYLIKPPS